jgi:hypothetical protein
VISSSWSHDANRIATIGIRTPSYETALAVQRRRTKTYSVNARTEPKITR